MTMRANAYSGGNMRIIYLRSLLLALGLVAIAMLDLLASRHGLSSRNSVPASVGAISHPA